MNEQRSKNDSLSPIARLMKIYQSLADDVLTIPLDTDEKTKERAVRLAHNAMMEALASEQIDANRSSGTSDALSRKKAEASKPSPTGRKASKPGKPRHLPRS